MIAVAVVLALTSCSVDKPQSDAPMPEGGKRVVFTIHNTKAKTRAIADVGGYDREKAINTLYAVAFMPDGAYHGTFAVSENNNEYSFDIGDAGAYYVYIVANPTITGFASKVYSHEATDYATDEQVFLADIEGADPGAGLAASTNFLMLSRRTLADVDADAVTDLGSIELVRAAARIDIDVSAITGLTIRKVTVSNRYVTTKLARVGNDVDVTTVTKETPAKEYVRGTGSGQVDAINDGTALVSDAQWQGVIYGYENPVSGTDQQQITVVEVEHEYGGLVRTTTVPFDNMPLKRNYLYTVVLQYADAANLKDIAYRISVQDWSSANLKFTSLSDDVAPSFAMTSEHVKDAATNPSLVRALIDTDNAITLTVTSGGAMGSDLVYLGGVVGADDDYTLADYTTANNSEAPIQMTGITYDDATGRIIQTYSISVPQALAQAMAESDYLRFRVANQFDELNAREFVIRSGKADGSITLSASEGSVNYNGTITFTVSENVSGGTLSVTPTGNSNTYVNATIEGNTVTVTGLKATSTPQTITVTSATTNQYKEASATYSVTVNKIAGSLSGLANKTFDRNAAVNATQTFTVSRAGDGQISATSSNANLASVAVNQSTGVVTVTRKAYSAGTVTITIGVAAGTNHNAVANQTCTVTVTKYDPYVSLSSAAVGYVVATNGYAYASKTAAQNAGANPIGVVTRTNNSTGYGYIVALYDCGGSTTTYGKNYYWNDRANAVAVFPSVSGKSWKVGTKDEYMTAITTRYSDVNNYIRNAGGMALSGGYWSSTTDGENAYSFSGANWSGVSRESATRHIRLIIKF
jgi:hypothetical protein